MVKEYLTYDDVLIKPGMSLESREDADVYIPFENSLVHPIIPANMDTISGKTLCIEALQNKGIAILHRFMSIDDRIAIYKEILYKLGVEGVRGLFISLGVSQSEFDGVEKLVDNGITRFCIDIAHGHSEKVANLITTIRNKCHYAFIIAGNVATVEGYEYLMRAGADIVKTGIGPGSHCTTRIVTGCGVPQLSAIMEIEEYRRNNGGPKIIADGGIKNSGDIVKALAAGADFVMVGALFAGCDETPGEIIKWNDGSKWKLYRGMASKDAQVGWKGLEESSIVAEGESSLVQYKGSFKNQLNQLLGGLKSGMSYIGASEISEMKKATFVRISQNALLENMPHGKRTA